jgi:hypothetical protein
MSELKREIAILKGRLKDLQNAGTATAYQVSIDNRIASLREDLRWARAALAEQSENEKVIPVDVAMRLGIDPYADEIRDGVYVDED